MRKKLLAACLALTLPAAAIELSLEENKAERGNIGYIDMHKLFRAYPETLRAKENFEELIRQAEEQLNLRKAEILRMRSELAELKIEREFLAKAQAEAATMPIEKTVDPNAPAAAVAVPAAAPTPAPTPAPKPKKGQAKGAAVEAPKGPTSLAAAQAAAKETRDRENAELSKLLEDAKKNPAPATPPPAEPVLPAPVSPAVVAPPPPAPPAPAPAPADGGGRRGAEPETDLTRPSIADLPGFANIPTSSQPVRGEHGLPNPAAQPAPVVVAAPAAPVPTGPTEEDLREALERSRKAAEAKRREPLIINIPGVSTAPIVVQPPSAPAPEKAPEILPEPLTPVELVSTSSVTTPAAPAAPVEPPLSQAVVELDAKIALKTKELASKEQEYRSEQSSSEKNLVDLESRKTEILLGKIHRAVQDIARKEGVSVVVDKSSILYGHDAVDLTDKVMKHLRGS
jgi:Skp family chaperone for outer membrane proteins